MTRGSEAGILLETFAPTTCLRRRAAARRRARAGSSRSGRCDNCCARPSATIPPQAFLRASCRRVHGFNLALHFLRRRFRQRGEVTEQTGKALAQPIPLFAHRPATAQAESSPRNVPDTPAARRECGALHNPSSNSCERRVVRWSAEIPRPNAQPIRRKDLRRRREDPRERLCRGAVQSARVKTWESSQRLTAKYFSSRILR